MSKIARVLLASLILISVQSFAWAPNFAFNQNVVNVSQELNKTWMPEPNSIVGLWHMNESNWNGSNNEMKDVSANGNHGTAFSAVSSASGKLNRGASFVGATSGSPKYITLLNTNFPTGAAERTIAFWFKLTSTSGSQSMFNYGTNSTGARCNVWFQAGTPAGIGIEGVSKTYNAPWTGAD